MRIKKGSLDYLDLVRSIDGRLIRMKDTGKADEKIYCLRHDVDYSMDKALAFAEVEAEHGLFSTFFLLHTAGYFDYSDEFLRKCKRLIKLGHDVGFHNDAVTCWYSSGGNIKDIINKPLSFLRNGGIKVIGTAAHGSKLCYEKKYLNYELWKEFDPTKNHGLVEGVPSKKFSLKDFGFEYEAYFLDYNAYLSDSGGNWIGLEVVKERAKLYEKDGLFFKGNLGREIIPKFNSYPNGFLHCLFHPTWWNIE